MDGFLESTMREVMGIRSLVESGVTAYKDEFYLMPIFGGEMCDG